jgi:hypothetical protein
MLVRKPWLSPNKLTWLLGASLVVGCSDKAMRSALDEGTEGSDEEDVSLVQSEQRSKKAPLPPEKRRRRPPGQGGSDTGSNDTGNSEARLEDSTEGFMALEWDLDRELKRNDVLEALFPEWEIKRLLSRPGARAEVSIDISLREEEADEEAGQLVLSGYMNLELKIGDRRFSSDFFNQGAVTFTAQGNDDVMVGTFAHTSGSTLNVRLKRHAPLRASQIRSNPWRGRLELVERGENRRLGVLEGLIGALPPND